MREGEYNTRNFDSLPEGGDKNGGQSFNKFPSWWWVSSFFLCTSLSISSSYLTKADRFDRRPAKGREDGMSVCPCVCAHCFEDPAAKRTGFSFAALSLSFYDRRLLLLHLILVSARLAPEDSAVVVAHSEVVGPVHDVEPGEGEREHDPGDDVDPLGLGGNLSRKRVEDAVDNVLGSAGAANATSHAAHESSEETLHGEMYRVCKCSISIAEYLTHLWSRCSSCCGRSSRSSADCPVLVVIPPVSVPGQLGVEKLVLSTDNGGSLDATDKGVLGI